MKKQNDGPKADDLEILGASGCRDITGPKICVTVRHLPCLTPKNYLLTLDQARRLAQDITDILTGDPEIREATIHEPPTHLELESFMEDRPAEVCPGNAPKR